MDSEKPNRIPFEAGEEYQVTFTIYGRAEVRVMIDAMEWGEGGDFGYDHDDEFRPNS